MSKNAGPVPRPRLVRRSLLLALLLLVAGAAGGSQAGDGAPFSAAAAHGMGAFRVEAAQSVLQAPAPAAGWTLTAERLEVTFVDDWRNHEVDHPLRPGDHLFSQAEHTVRKASFSDARIRVVGVGEPNATLILLPHGAPLGLEASLPTGFTLTPDPDDVLERSHFAGADAVFAERFDYQVALSSTVPGPRVRLVPPVATVGLDGPARLYAWGAAIEVQSGAEREHYRTGYWRDESVAGLHGASHYAYVFLNMTGARMSQDVHGARLHATGLRIGGPGSITYEGATGVVPSRDGAIEASNSTLVAIAGQYDVAPRPGGLGVATRQAPSAIVGQGVAVQAGGPLVWPWASAALVLVAGLSYVAPYHQGCCLRRKGRVARTSTARGLRTEGFSHWASRAETLGYRRLAALLAGRAARNSPLDGDAHMEYAIRLQRVGRWRKALREHEAAGQLYGMTPDGGHSSLNAYHAAVACTRLGQVPDALYWLQHAVEGDPGWAPAAHRDPGLAPLRGHPDFQAIAGGVHPMR
jgi:hypothetical protein